MRLHINEPPRRISTRGLIVLIGLVCGIACSLPAATNTGRTNLSLLTNQSAFTGATWYVPRRDAGYPEVQEIFKTDPFQDVYEKDTESAFRRFEIVFVISLPALLLIDNLLIRTYNAVAHENFNRAFDTTQNWVFYGGSVALAGIIAVKDYFDTRKWKKRQMELELWRGRF